MILLVSHAKSAVVVAFTILANKHACVQRTLFGMMQNALNAITLNISITHLSFASVAQPTKFMIYRWEHVHHVLMTNQNSMGLDVLHVHYLLFGILRWETAQTAQAEEYIIHRSEIACVVRPTLFMMVNHASSVIIPNTSITSLWSVPLAPINKFMI